MSTSISKSNLVSLSGEENGVVAEALTRYELPVGERNILRNTVGYVNKTYIIEIGAEKFVLRRSSTLTAPEHLEFEVEVLRYLESTGYPLSPRLLANKEGAYLTDVQGSVWMLQSFIIGEIRASWNNVEHFEGEMLRNFFRASAEFTKAAQRFKPSKKYSNFPLPYYTKNAEELLSGLITRLHDSPGKAFLLEQKQNLLDFAQETQKKFEEFGWETLPQQLVHFDFHPGNVHYEGEKVVGVFDFDWARMDCRVTEIAGSIGQTCWVVRGPESGLYIKSKVDEGVHAYREAYGKSEFSLEEERQLIQVGLKGYMFFQLLWAGEWYQERYPDVAESWVVELNANACLRNDYEALFS